jgi:hypothetical protein
LNAIKENRRRRTEKRSELKQQFQSAICIQKIYRLHLLSDNCCGFVIYCISVNMAFFSSRIHRSYWARQQLGAAHIIINYLTSLKNKQLFNIGLWALETIQYFLLNCIRKKRLRHYQRIFKSFVFDYCRDLLDQSVERVATIICLRKQMVQNVAFSSVMTGCTNAFGSLMKQYR